MSLRALLCAAVLCAAPASAQVNAFGFAGSQTAAGPTSPELVGSAFSGVALPSDGAGSFLLNPARLASVEAGISASLPARRFAFDLFRSDDPPVQSAQSLVAGFGREASAWRFGAGFGRSAYSFTQQQTDQSGNEAGTLDFVYSSLVLGGAAAYQGAVTASFGIAARHVSEPLSGLLQSDGSFTVEDESGWGVDLGAQVGIPVVRAQPAGGFSAEVGLGYALQNWGPDLSIRIDETADSRQIPYPLAARARLGWSASFGYDTALRDRPVRALQVDVALEASHLLTRQTQEALFDPPGNPAPLAQPPAYRAAAPLGRIRPLDALLGRSRSPDGSTDSFDADAPGVVGHRSVRLEAFEAVTVRLGVHGSPFRPTEETVFAWGAGLSTAGLLRLLAPASGLASIAEAGDFRLDYAWYELYQESVADIAPDYRQPWTLGATLVARWP